MPATQLVNELVEAADAKQPSNTIARYGRVDLLCSARRRRLFTDPGLCAAIVDRLTSNGAIIQTGTEYFRLAHTEAQAERADAS